MTRTSTLSSSSKQASSARTLTAGFCLTLVALAACYSVLSSPAEAARSIEPPAGFSCETFARTISISPPRISSSYNQLERVAWMTHIHRWNGARWYVYTENVSYSSFDYYGRAVTPWWSGGGGSGFQHTTLNIRVSHPGHYRVAAAIRGDQGGVQWVALVRGGASCYIR